MTAAASVTTTTSISVGAHITGKFLSMTVNIDDIISCLVAGAIVLILGFWMRAKATPGVPGRLQMFFEAIIGWVQDQVTKSMGKKGKAVIPLAVTIFLYILIANWLEMLPTGHNPQYLPAPTGDINFTAAMAVFVIVLVHITHIRKQGIKAYIGHYFKPYVFLFPINVIEEITKPITLALRLFGNIFAGGILLLLISDLIPAKLIIGIPILDVGWKLFDGLFVGPIQAFIFTLLTIMYFESAIAGPEHQ